MRGFRPPVTTAQAPQALPKRRFLCMVSTSRKYITDQQAILAHTRPTVPAGSCPTSRLTNGTMWPSMPQCGSPLPFVIFCAHSNRELTDSKEAEGMRYRQERPESHQFGRRRIQEWRLRFLVGSSFVCLLAPLLLSCQSSTTANSSSTNKALIVAIGADPAALGFNPRTNANIAGRRMDAEIYDGLVEKNYYDPSKPFTLVPGLATSWGVSSDGLTWTFHLRQGVKFTDGSGFDASAVVFNLQTLLDPTSQYFDKAAAPGMARYTSYIASYAALDANTFQMVLKAPFGALLDEWSLPAQTWIISPTAIKTYGMAGISQHPVGTGPFKLDSYTPGQSIVLSRNDQYFRGPASIKQLVLRPITDPAARAAALEAGEVQIAEDISVQYKQAWATRKDVTVEVQDFPAPYTCYLDARNAPTSNADFRQALNLAVNRSQINQLAQANLATIPNGQFAKGTPSYVQGDTPLAYDPTKAASTIAQLGLKGSKFVYDTTPTLGDPAVWDILNQNLSDAGLAAQARSLDLPTFLADLNKSTASSMKTAGVNAICSLSGTDSDWTFVTNYNPQHVSDPTLTMYINQAKSATTTSAYNSALATASHQSTIENYDLIVAGNLLVNGLATNVVWKPPAGAQSHIFYNASFK